MPQDASLLAIFSNFGSNWPKGASFGKASKITDLWKQIFIVQYEIVL